MAKKNNEELIPEKVSDKTRRFNNGLTVVFGIVAVIYVLPIILVLVNSFKENTYVKTQTFSLPNSETFVGWANYIKGFTFGNYPFLKSIGYSFVITIVSTALILICTSMVAWYIVRVDNLICKIVYLSRR